MGNDEYVIGKYNAVRNKNTSLPPNCSKI